MELEAMKDGKMNCKRCGEDIDKHEAGRETDACVAEVVMVWEIKQEGFTKDYKTHYSFGYYNTNDAYMGHPHDWNPSTDIAAAWKVVELFRSGKQPHSKGLGVACYIRLYIDDCMPTVGDCTVRIDSPSMYEVIAFANNMPLAVCRASLKAMASA